MLPVGSFDAFVTLDYVPIYFIAGRSHNRDQFWGATTSNPQLNPVGSPALAFT
jgi:hypothetical protein